MQKLAQARVFVERFGIERPVLVDDLAGTGHQLYGLLPNMTYLVGRGGRVLFRADWTDPPTIEQAIRYLLDARSRRREGLGLKPFFAEFLGYRWSSQAAFMEELEVAGPQSGVGLPGRHGSLGKWQTAERAHRTAGVRGCRLRGPRGVVFALGEKEDKTRRGYRLSAIGSDRLTTHDSPNVIEKCRPL